MRFLDPKGAIAGLPYSATQTASGAFVLVQLSGPPLVFDGAGRFMRELSTVGDGPGEFRSAAFARIGPGDSVWISDGSQIELFSPNLRFVRSIPVNLQMLGMIPVENALMISGFTAMGQDTSHTVFAVSPATGAVQNSMALRSRRSPMAFIPKIGPGSHRTVVGASHQDRALMFYTADGGERRIPLPPAPWMVRLPAKVVSQVKDVRQVGGVVWLLTWTPAAGADTILSRRSGEGSIQSLPYERLFDTQLEAFDATSGAMLASQLVPGLLVGFVADARVMKYSVDSNDLPQLTVLNLTLSR